MRFRLVLVMFVLGLLLWRPRLALWVTFRGMACALLTSVGLAELSGGGHRLRAC